MEIKLLSGALGAEIKGIDLKDTSDQNFKKINDLLLEHKVIFFRNQKITEEEHMALAEKFGPLETHAYVKGLDKFPEIVRIIKAEDEKNQWGENWHSDVSYNVKPTKAVIIKSIKIPPVGGDTCFSNMELAWEILNEKIKENKIYSNQGFISWEQQWQERLKLHNNSPEKSLKLMHSANPLVIPRNHKVEEALEAANNDDLNPMKNLLKVLEKPYESQKGISEYQSPAPASDQKYQTFCGT